MSTTTGRRPPIDDQCASAVDLARRAAEELGGPEHVGDHLGVMAEGERVVTHHLDCLLQGYRGWHWAVTVARAARARRVTVNEVVLLPGDDAILAPAWVPWSDRLQPGDLGPGDLLPALEHDPRLVAGYTGADEEPAEFAEVAPVAYELGLGRARVLSWSGRDDAARRWYSGDSGPHSPIAKAAPAPCSTCGFLVSLRGPLRMMFGVCANEYSPSDGRVVSLDHGCGAHSEAALAPSTPTLAPPILDEFGYEEL